MREKALGRWWECEKERGEGLRAVEGENGALVTKQGLDVPHLALPNGTS